MGRLIDAEQCPCNDCVPPLGDSKGCSIFPCREFGEWYENTIYDVDKVVEELEEEQEKWLRGYNQTLEMGMEHLWRNLSGRAYGVASAIDIVKRGRTNGID